MAILLSRDPSPDVLGLEPRACVTETGHLELTRAVQAAMMHQRPRCLPLFGNVLHRMPKRFYSRLAHGSLSDSAKKSQGTS